MKVRLVTRRELAAGFELTGVEVISVRDAGAAADEVARAIAGSDLAVVLVDESLYNAIPRDTRARWDWQAIPMVVPIPAPVWERVGGAEAYILDILRQAIGYQVRPR
jgi:vacuolar-type H+-ATPase subunit F/Vma7